jgi:hypothetical protein
MGIDGDGDPFLYRCELLIKNQGGDKNTRWG